MTYNRDRAMADIRRLQVMIDPEPIISGLTSGNSATRRIALAELRAVCERMWARREHWTFDQSAFNTLVGIYRHEKHLLKAV